MSADNRSVHTDALATLGTIIGPDAGKDAIHLAVYPIQAGEHLFPGTDVLIYNGKAYQEGDGKKVGIVDPFLPYYPGVEEGQWFWLIVYPRQITSLRHVWEHPDFPGGTIAPTQVASSPSASEEWIREFGNRYRIHYDTLMEGAKQWLEDKEYLCFGGVLEGEHVPDEFWDHYEIVTGHDIPYDKRGNFFTCSC